MADCSKTEDFFREKARMCEALQCAPCLLSAENNGTAKSCSIFTKRHTKEAIEIVQRWSDENPEIKKCPFCGDVAVAFKKFDEVMQINTYSVVCDGCGIGTGEYDIKAEAIALWNKRAENRGKWVYTGRGNSWECTHCKSCLDMSDDENGHARYCPQCGANMRGGAADE